MRVLTTGTLSIGRASGNDWVLDDPDRLLSKTHCIIGGSPGRYKLTDISTNGVFVNGAVERVPRGGDVPLNDGDEFRLGDYVIRVAEVVAPEGAPTGRRQVDPLVDPMGSMPDPLAGDALDDPFGVPAPGFHHPIRAPRAAARPSDDPFDLLDAAGRHPPDPADDLFAGRAPAENWRGASQADNADAPLHAFAAPPPINPDEIDFDALLGDLPLEQNPPPATPATVAPAAAPFPVPMPPMRVAEPPVAARAAAETGSALRAFLEGAGVPGLALGSDQDAALRAAGEVFRAMVEGIRDVLISRAAVKNEFRVEQTMLRTRDNNALKFSVTPEDAVAALLQSARPGYMPPVKAAREAFDDVRAHELAVMAAVQTALLGLVKRFEPAALEKRLQPGLLGNLLPGARKARTWELFCATWHDIAHEAEDDFQALFGSEFARAYDAQMRKL